MHLVLQVLDGPRKDSFISPRTSLTLGSKAFADKEMLENHAEFYLDQTFSWNIKCLGDEKIRFGSTETKSLALAEGLVFHLGQTGFKVIERPFEPVPNWESGLTSWLEQQDWTLKSTNIVFFRYPIRLTFLQGPQVDEFYTLSYGPRLMGFNQIDINIKDPTLPSEMLRFYLKKNAPFVENLSDNKVLVNNVSFDHHPIANGDKLQFGTSIVELTILK